MDKFEKHKTKIPKSLNFSYPFLNLGNAHHMNLGTPNHPSQQGVALSWYLHRVLLSSLRRGVADRAPTPTCFDQRCPTPTSSIDHDVREKPKGSARVMWSFRPREGGESTDRCEVCRERETKKNLVKFF